MNKCDGLDVFYPIVPDVDWLRRVVPLGVRTIQLRLKEATDSEIRHQIAASMDVAGEYGCQLIVNDYWSQAIELGADFVHLGQEDLATADVAAIRDAGLKLGISTHDPAELDIALAVDPDYIALGPIFETKLKKMKWAPQGLPRVSEWKRRVGRRPLVAIGGITPRTATDVLAAGADSVSVITDFLTHPDPEQRVRDWIALLRN